MTSRDKIRLLDLGPQALEKELSGRLEAWGEKPFRLRQVLRHIYQRCTLDFQDMTDLGRELRERLAENYLLPLLKPVERRRSKDGTVKTLWTLAEDNARVEGVTIPMERGRHTLCISTQTGCAFGCRFCATGRLGAGRNLSAGEIVGQVLDLLAGSMQGSGPRVRDGDRVAAPNIVVMGMGEPLLNYDNLKTAIEVLNHPGLCQIGSRRITVSTVGLPEEIVRFSREFPQMKLALSLHAATDRLRRSLMPVAARVSLSDLLEACRQANEITGKKITIEYLVIPTVNDRDEDVRALAAVSRSLHCKINLIGLNPVKGMDFRAPTPDELESFRLRLSSACGQEVTVRASRGADIAGACGQLAARCKTTHQI